MSRAGVFLALATSIPRAIRFSVMRVTFSSFAHGLI